MSMDPNAVFDMLVERDVLAPSNGDLRKSDAFLDHVEAKQSDLPESIADQDDLLSEDEKTSLEKLIDVSPRAVAEYLTVVQTCGDQLTDAERTWVVSVLDTFEPDPVPDEGAPELHIPISGQKVPFIEQFFKKAIVYFWRYDCDPCDLVRDDFNELLEVPDDEIAYFSVFGPNASELLYEEYDVGGAPTTLFFLNGRVDVRLVGASYPNVLEKEVNYLREL